MSFRMNDLQSFGHLPENLTVINKGFALSENLAVSNRASYIPNRYKQDIFLGF